MSEFTWSNIWEYCKSNSPDRYGAYSSIASLILSLPAEEQIKALEDAPDEFVERIRPYLKPEARLKPYEMLLPVKPEDWAEARKLWNNIKETK